jgi:hypothetical protein
MMLIGLDVNATRIVALSGPEGAPPRPLPLGDETDELPTFVSLQGRQPAVGKSGTAILREWPHLVCHDFLAFLGKPRTWSAARHKLDATKALTVVGEKLKPHLSSAKAATAVFPAYLSQSQGTDALGVFQKLRLPVVGSVASPLAAGLAVLHLKRWTGYLLLIDVDDHALAWSFLKPDSDRIIVHESRSLPHLGFHAWKMCLLDAISERCVRHSRRDPRDSGAAEQLLYDQLDDVFTSARQDRLVEVVVRTSSWCQNLFLQPEQVNHFCKSRAEQTADELGAAIASINPETVAAVWLTDAAARLSGLLPLVQEIVGENVPVASLPADAIARTAHELAARMHRGELPHSHVDTAIALPRHRPAAGASSFLKIPTFGADR